MERRPIWLWPNLLSLDAPLVAMAWLWMFAKTWHVVWFPKTIYLLVAAAVWIIYVVDRLLDARIHPNADVSDRPRHRFHCRHRKKFGIVVGVVALGCVGILLNLPPDLWWHGSFVLLFVAAYFMMVFLQGSEGISYFKNVLAGLAFAYGTVVGMHFYRPSSNLFWLIFSPEVLVFGVLCIANITAIDFWEQAGKSRNEDEKTAYEVVLSLLLIIVAGFALLLAMKAERYTQPFYYAVMVGAALLHVVNRARTLFSVDTMRVLADLAMLLPFPVFVLYPLFDRWMN